MPRRRAGKAERGGQRRPIDASHPNSSLILRFPTKKAAPRRLFLLLLILILNKTVEPFY